MDNPLWTERYAPSVDDIQQENARQRLQQVQGKKMNLIIYGPAGCGKTASARAIAREAHDYPDEDLIEINVADFFNRSKKEIRNDPRFESFLQGRSRMAKRDMINRVLKETARNSPVSGGYKTVLLDNAESIREDFQQSLRRIMERYHESTQFIIATRQPSKLISPIRSRCFVVPMNRPTDEQILTIVTSACEQAEIQYSEAGIAGIISHANRNIRAALLSAQTVAEQSEEITDETVAEVLTDVTIEESVLELFDDVESGDFKQVRKDLGTLLTDEGYDGDELLEELLRIAEEEYSVDQTLTLHRAAGDVDMAMSEGSDDRIHLMRLLTQWRQEALV